MAKTAKQQVLPRGKYILVKPEAPEALLSSTGLSMPANTDKEQKAQGTVLAVGDQVGTDLKKGDVVIFGAYAGESLTMMEGKEQVDYKLLHDDDVIAKIE